MPDDIKQLAKDAARYRWIRDTFSRAVCAYISVNDERACYEIPEPGKAVRVQWYPDTPIGFYVSEADTLDAAIDAAQDTLDD